MPRLLLIRHAQSQANLAQEQLRRHRDDSERFAAELALASKHDPDLSPIGHQQAQMLGEELGPLLAEFGDRALLITSPMRRALQTAMPIAIHAKLDPRRFVCHGELFEVGSPIYRSEHRPSQVAAQLEAEYPLRCAGIPSDELYGPRTHGESLDEARVRVERVIAWTQASLETGEHDLLVVITHGHLLTRWLRAWIGVPWARGLAFMHANVGMSMIGWNRDDGVLVEFINDTGRLPIELQTGGKGGWWAYCLPDIEIQQLDDDDLPESLAAEIAELQRGSPALVDVSPPIDPDGEEELVIHFVARVLGKLAGYVRYEVGSGRLRQLVVSPSYRRARLGRRIVTEVEREATMLFREELLVHAPLEAVAYFQALGFVARGEPVDAAVPWQAMAKTLPSPL